MLDMLDLENYSEKLKRSAKSFAQLVLGAQLLQAVQSDNVKALCSQEFWPPVNRLLKHADVFIDKFEREEARQKAAGLHYGAEATERVFDANSILFRLSDAVIDCPEADAELLVAAAQLMAHQPERAGYLRVLLRAGLNAAKASVQ